MIDLKDLDTILIFLLKERTNGHNLDNILSLFGEMSKLSDREVMTVMAKLVKDGYVDEEKRVLESPMGGVPDMPYSIYSLSIDGLLFCKSGGYQGLAALKSSKQETESITNRRLKRIADIQVWFVVVSGIVSALALWVSWEEYKLHKADYKQSQADNSNALKGTGKDELNVFVSSFDSIAAPYMIDTLIVLGLNGKKILINHDRSKIKIEKK